MFKLIRITDGYVYCTGTRAECRKHPRYGDRFVKIYPVSGN